MNKIAQYLNKHLLGEVTTDPRARASVATDGSILTITPEMVAYPTVTNDIRKVTRFAWQLAEKGHTLPVVPRGAGTDTTGAAIGKGVVLDMSRHMNRVYEYDQKQKLVRLQPGVSTSALRTALALYGTGIPALSRSGDQTTIGGHIASSRSASDYVSQLELVLSNGDVLQTKRLTKRELAKKKGLQTFEGEIYRNIDALLEDFKDVIDEKCDVEHDEHAGYYGIDDVKRKDGSFDLTPLFVASQGTLAIVSEMILKTEFTNQTPAIAIACFASLADAHDAIDASEDVSPSDVEFYDAAYFDAAKLAGKQYDWYEDAGKDEPVAAVIVLTFNDFSEKTRSKKLKKLAKRFKPLNAHLTTATDATISDLHAVHGVTTFMHTSDKATETAVPLLTGVYIPFDRYEAFSQKVVELAAKYHVDLPLYGRPLVGVWSVWPKLHLATTAGKQTALKLINDYAALAAAHEGTLFGQSGEGRLAGLAAQQLIDPALQEVFKEIKTIFDPYGVLNTGVKQTITPHDLASHMRSEYTAS